MATHGDLAPGGNTAAVRIERDGPVASIVLANPPLNLFTRDALHELCECVSRVGESDARALVWRAEGKVFSAGVDVELFERVATAGPHRADEITGPVLTAVHGIEALPIPTLALVERRCLTVGFEIALACDLIWAAESASFGLVEATVGLTTVGAVQRLAERAGSGRAREVVYTGRVYDAPTLHGWGVLNRVVPDSELLASGMDFARELGEGPTLAHAATKEIVQAFGAGGLEQADGCARKRFGELFATADLQHGVRSFLGDGPGKATFTGA